MITRLIAKFLRIAWFLPGFLLWASFPPMGEKTDVLFALAPLMWLTRRADVKTSAKRCFQSGMFFWIATLSWMPAIVKNGGPWPLVALGWFALAAYCAAYFAAYGSLSAAYWQWARKGAYGRRLLGILLVEPILWCGLELVRSRLFGGFAWNQLGVVPVNGGYGAPAALGGVYLCSAVVILINGTIAGIAERVWRPELSGFGKLRKFGSVETLLAFALVYVLHQGSADLPASRPSDLPASRPLKVAMIQRNFPCCFSGTEEDPIAAYSNLLANVACLRPDVVVLPESATCEFGAADRARAVAFARWVSDRTGAPAVLAGGSRREDGREYNSAALYQFARQSPQTPPDVSFYDKVHLVPFGEYIPGDKLITALQKLAPVGSCTPGELKTLGVKIPPDPPDLSNPSNLSLGVAICYEDTDSSQMRALAKRGAQVLFFVTNDSWFSRSVEAEQHAWQAVARAIETGLPVVRVGNSGVTGTVTPDGKASWLTGPDGRPLTDRRGTMLDRVAPKPPQTPQTPYVRFGDIPLICAFALLIGAMFLVKYRNDYEKRRYLSM